MNLLRPPDWTLAAACADLDPTLWDHSTPTARAVCAHCPVRHPCALEALQDAIPDGMWGGLDPDDRATIAAHWPGYDRPGTAPHGRRSRYVAGCRCLACTRANADWAQARRAAGAWTGRGRDSIPATGTRRISA